MLVKEHPENEHWWEVKNEDGETGYVPSSYVIIKDDQVRKINSSEQCSVFAWLTQSRKDEAIKDEAIH